jgi:hypothetical protein
MIELGTRHLVAGHDREQSAKNGRNAGRVVVGLIVAVGLIYGAFVFAVISG